MPDVNDALPVYQIEYADSAQEEFEKANLWRSGITSPEAAALWAEGLRGAIDGLSTLPYRYETARDYPPARRLLYGRGTGAYRIIYLVVEPHEPDKAGIVRVLHIYHGARQANTSDTSSST